MLIGANEEQKKKYIGQLANEPIVAVSFNSFLIIYNHGSEKKHG